MKQKVSLAFTLLAIYCLMTLSNVLNVIFGIVNLFANLSVMAIVNYVTNVASALVPLALLAALYMNTKKDFKKETALICLAASILNFYSVYKNMRTMFYYLADGAYLVDMFYLFGSPVLGLTCGILFILVYQQITKGSRSAMTKTVGCIGGFAYFFVTTLSLLIGTGGMGSLISGILLVIGLCCLPATVIDRETAVMTTKASLKPIFLLLVVALLVIGISGIKTGTFSSGSSSESSSSCGYCQRSFTDSSNKKSIARTGMCSNCTGNYKSMTGWLDDMN